MASMKNGVFTNPQATIKDSSSNSGRSSKSSGGNLRRTLSTRSVVSSRSASVVWGRSNGGQRRRTRAPRTPSVPLIDSNSEDECSRGNGQPSNQDYRTEMASLATAAASEIAASSRHHPNHSRDRRSRQHIAKNQLSEVARGYFPTQSHHKIRTDSSAVDGGRKGGGLGSCQQSPKSMLTPHHNPEAQSLQITSNHIQMSPFGYHARY